MIITNSLGSNYSGEDIRLSLSLLFQPWRWKNGPELEILKSVIPAKAGIYTNRFRVPPSLTVRLQELFVHGSRSAVWRASKPGMTSDVRLFYKGRQAIGEALRILKIGPGDEVIVQAFTCAAVVQPILEAGATPIYVDVASRRLNPPLSSIKAAVNSKTKAVILQHTLGFVNSENEKIVSWCKQKGVTVIQDLAHSLGALGIKRSNLAAARLDLNTLYVLSFSQDKVIDGVSGGALVLPPDRSSLQLINKLINWSNFEVLKNLFYPLLTMMIRKTYQTGLGRLIHFIGKKLGLMQSPIDAETKPTAMTNALAALALNQFHRLDKISNHRRQIALLYNEVLNSKLKIVSKDEILAGANLRYPIWVNNRNELEEKLKGHGFFLVDHWYDAPVSPEWVDPEEVKYKPGSCPNAEELAKYIFNLPTHVNISNEKAVQLIKLVNQYAGNLKV